MLFTCSKPIAVAPEIKRERQTNCPKPIIKTPERRQIVNFEQANTRWELLNSCSVEENCFPKVSDIKSYCQVV